MFKPENDDNALAAMAGAPQKQGLSEEDRKRRDMFAAAALTGFTSNTEFLERIIGRKEIDPFSHVGNLAFKYADEMLKASEKS